MASWFRTNVPGNGQPSSVFVSGTVVFRIPYRRIVAEPASDNSGNVMLRRGEIREHRHGVVGGRREPQPLLPKVVDAALQLHELRLTVRSPIGRAVERSHETVRAHQ